MSKILSIILHTGWNLRYHLRFIHDLHLGLHIPANRRLNPWIQEQDYHSQLQLYDSYGVIDCYVRDGRNNAFANHSEHLGTAMLSLL